MKGLLTLILLTAFIGGAFFSISAMNHNQGVTMNGDCPMSPLHTSVCPTGDLSVVAHYLSMYQAFTNGLASSTVTQVLMAVLLFVTAIFILRKYLTPILSLFILSRDYRAKLYRPQTLTRWLSLLVNSPSLI